MLYVTLVHICDMLLVHESSLIYRRLMTFGNASFTEVIRTKFVLFHWFFGG